METEAREQTKVLRFVEIRGDFGIVEVFTDSFDGRPFSEGLSISAYTRDRSPEGIADLQETILEAVREYNHRWPAE